MLKKFQALVNTILENMNAAGAGGSLGTPQEPVYNPPSNVNSSDSMARNDARNIYGGEFTVKKRKKGKKYKKSPLIIRRNLPKKDL
jgi:hypothetical protein